MPSQNRQRGGNGVPEQSASDPATSTLAFEDVYRLYHHRVVHFCLALARNRDAAEDLAADVFLAAYLAYERVRPAADTVHLWLFRIAKNRFINQQRRARRLQSILDSLGRSQHPTADVETHAATRDNVQRILDAIAALPPRERSLLGMRVGRGLSIAQIGTEMNMTRGAASSATFRAIKRVRSSLDETAADVDRYHDTAHLRGKVAPRIIRSSTGRPALDV
jgi:RNA polymerase sigma factor (sigma-70 family)